MKLSSGGAGPGWRAGSAGCVLRAGTDGGQRLLAAVQEGRVVGALVEAVVVVRLPPLPLPLPLTAEDPNKGLRRKKTSKQINPASQTGRVFGAIYLFELPAVARVDDGVQAAVEVAQPKNDFKKCVRWTKTAVEGACGNKHTHTRRK